MAKQLNSQQSRGYLFIFRFNLNITYRPFNIKLNALLRQYSPNQATVSPEPTPTTCTIMSLSWDLEAQIERASQSEPDAGGGPPNRLYIFLLHLDPKYSVGATPHIFSVLLGYSGSSSGGHASKKML